MNDLQKTSLERICALHASITGSLVSCVEMGIEIGGLLQQQKDALPHGMWLSWIKDNLPFTDRTARNYMGLYANRSKIGNVSDLTAAYKLLAVPKPEVEDSTSAMEKAVALFKEASEVVRDEIRDESLPLSYWIQVKAAADKAFQVAREYTLTAERQLGKCITIEEKHECLISWGNRATASGHSDNLGFWFVTVLPSTTEPFFWISAIFTDGGDAGGVLDFLKKPVRGDYVGECLRWLHIPVDSAEFEITPTEERFEYPIGIWSSREDWLNGVKPWRTEAKQQKSE